MIFNTLQLTAYFRTYSYDPGTNLQQMSSSSGVIPRRMMVSSRSNRSIDEPLYSSLDLEQKRDLDASIDTFFDVHGNQKQTGAPALTNQWDCSNQIQRTEQVAPDGSRTLEYSVYVVQGKRSRKILERQDALGNVYHIRETVYLEELEYQTTWQGDNLVYDGEDVTDAESGEMVSPIEASHTLRIREGHRQIGERKVFTVKAGQVVDEAETLFSLDNRIDSCQTRLDPSGELKSFLSYAPYGQTTQSFGETADQRYRYSGQEEEDSGLYAYGFRSYLPSCYRWMSPDPAGMSGSGLNRYAMVDGNPVSMRDEMGLMLEWLFGTQESNSKTMMTPPKKPDSRELRLGKEFWQIHNLLYEHVGSDPTRVISSYLFSGLIQHSGSKYTIHLRSWGFSAGYVKLGTNFIKPRRSIESAKNLYPFAQAINYAREVIPYSPNRVDDKRYKNDTIFQKSAVRSIIELRTVYGPDADPSVTQGVDPQAEIPTTHLFAYIHSNGGAFIGLCQEHSILVSQFILHQIKEYEPFVAAMTYQEGKKDAMIKEGFELDHGFVVALRKDQHIHENSIQGPVPFQFLVKHQAAVVDAWDKIAFHAHAPEGIHLLATIAHAASGGGKPVKSMTPEQGQAFERYARFKLYRFHKSVFEKSNPTGLKFLPHKK